MLWTRTRARALASFAPSALAPAWGLVGCWLFIESNRTCLLGAAPLTLMSTTSSGALPNPLTLARVTVAAAGSRACRNAPAAPGGVPGGSATPAPV